MLAVLVDHIGWEAYEARALHRGLVPAAHILAVLLQHLHRHRVEADQGLGCPGDDGRGTSLGEGLAGQPCLARLAQPAVADVFVRVLSREGGPVLNQTETTLLKSVLLKNVLSKQK